MGDVHPPYSMADFKESTVPGCRLPHFFLADGSSLYDALGKGYTLIRFDDAVSVEAIMKSAEALNFPLTLLSIQGVQKPAAYITKLVIARPDQHVAWRGDALPSEPKKLLQLLAGHC